LGVGGIYLVNQHIELSNATKSLFLEIEAATDALR
jgi:hypothetical protein